MDKIPKGMYKKVKNIKQNRFIIGCECERWRKQKSCRELRLHSTPARCLWQLVLIIVAP